MRQSSLPASPSQIQPQDSAHSAPPGQSGNPPPVSSAPALSIQRIEAQPRSPLPQPSWESKSARRRGSASGACAHVARYGGQVRPASRVRRCLSSAQPLSAQLSQLARVAAVGRKCVPHSPPSTTNTHLHPRPAPAPSPAHVPAREPGRPPGLKYSLQTGCGLRAAAKPARRGSGPAPRHKVHASDTRRPYASGGMKHVVPAPGAPAGATKPVCGAPRRLGSGRPEPGPAFPRGHPAVLAV